MTLENLLDPVLESGPDRVAVGSGGREFTYRELDNLAQRLAVHWLNADLRPSDRVILWLRNSPELIAGYLACWKAGLIAVPIDYRHEPLQARFILHHCGARGALIGAERQADLASTDCLSQLAGVVVAHGRPTLNEAVPLDSLEVQELPTTWPVPVGDQLGTIFYTSGTTSRPKGVVHSGSRTLRRVEMLVRECRLGPDTISLVCLSLLRPLAFQLQALAVLRVGGRVVTLPQFSPGAFWEAYSQPPTPTLLAFTPNQLATVLDHPAARAADHSGLRLCLAGADAVPLPLHALFRAITGQELVEICGMTETGPYALNPPFGRKVVGSIGLPPEGVTLRIVNERGEDMPLGQLGEIVVQTPDLMLGYWNDTLLSFQALRDGWLWTGDIGRIDPEGYVHFQGRLKEVIVRDGDKISPIAVEEALESHPAVMSSVVVGVDDPPHGQAVEAFVCWQPNLSVAPTVEELRSHVAERVPALAVPRAIYTLESWPRTSQGKIDRQRLQWVAAAGGVAI